METGDISACTLNLYMEASDQLHVPAVLNLGKFSRLPKDRRLSGPRFRSAYLNQSNTKTIHSKTLN
jgi:hypothetical protein